MEAGIHGPVAMEMEGILVPSGSSIHAFSDWLGMHISPDYFPLSSPYFLSNVISTNIAMVHMTRGGHMGSHWGGRGMVCYNIPMGLPSTPPFIVSYLSTCSGELEDSRIIYNLRNHILLTNH